MQKKISEVENRKTIEKNQCIKKIGSLKTSVTLKNL